MARPRSCRLNETVPGIQPHWGNPFRFVPVPFISEESAKICTEAGIGYADLAGNARLSFDHVFIETRSPENPFREKRETRSLFAPRATRALRVVLQGPLRAWKVVELAESARVSLGCVSAVRQQLLAREWAAEEPGGLNLHLDFLTEDAPSLTGARMVDDVVASVIPGVNRVLSCRRNMNVKGLDYYGAEQECEVALANIGPLLVLKLNAFGGPTGRRLPKDAYDVLRKAPGNWTFVVVTDRVELDEQIAKTFKA
jgi:hypothetical protein